RRYRQVTNPESSPDLLRQTFEEALHTHAFHYIVETLALDPEQVFNMYREVPAITRKDEFEMQLTQDLLRDDFSTRTTAGLQRFLENLLGYYVSMEGIFFSSGLAVVLSFL